jgi:hypothetical protein
MKRIMAVLTFVLASAGLLLSLAGALGVWIVKEPVSAKATHLFGRIDAALDIANQGLDYVKTSLARASEQLRNVKEEQRQLAQRPQQNNVLQRTLARTVQQKIAPEIGNANQKLHAVAEAAVVVNTVLEDVGSFPFLSVSGLDVGKLTELNNRLSTVGPAAWELSRLLGEPEPDQNACNQQLSGMEQTLQRMQGLAAECEVQLTQFRQRKDQLQSWTLPWITPAAVLLSLACIWIALSQVSMLFHARAWWRHSGASCTHA